MLLCRKPPDVNQIDLVSDTAKRLKQLSIRQLPVIKASACPPALPFPAPWMKALSRSSWTRCWGSALKSIYPDPYYVQYDNYRVWQTIGQPSAHLFEVQLGLKGSCDTPFQMHLLEMNGQTTLHSRLSSSQSVIQSFTKVTKPLAWFKVLPRLLVFDHLAADFYYITIWL